MDNSSKPVFRAFAVVLGDPPEEADDSTQCEFAIGIIRDSGVEWRWVFRTEARFNYGQVSGFLGETSPHKQLGSFGPLYGVVLAPRDEAEYALSIISAAPSITAVLPRGPVEEYLSASLGVCGVDAPVESDIPPATLPTAESMILIGVSSSASDPSLWGVGLRLEAKVPGVAQLLEDPGLGCLWVVNIGKASRGKWEEFVTESSLRVEINWPPGLLTVVEIDSELGSVTLLSSSKEVATLKYSRIAILNIFRKALQIADTRGCAFEEGPP